MALTPTTVGAAIGLTAEPRDYTNQVIGAQKYKEAKEAAKRKGEEEEFQKFLGDVKVDYNQFHRIDREKARQMYSGWLNKAYQAYQTKDPNWRTQVSMTGQELMFGLQQLRDTSANRKAFDTAVASGNFYIDDNMKQLYQWNTSGDPNQPPQIQPNPYSSIQNYDPETGTGDFIPTKYTDVGKFVTNLIGDPKQFEIDPNLKSVGNKKFLYTETGIYDEQAIRDRARQAIGSPEYRTWMNQNAPQLYQSLNANPNADPTQVAVTAWEDFVVNQIPEVSKQKLTGSSDININMGAGADRTTKKAGYGPKEIYVAGTVLSADDPESNFASTYKEDGRTDRNFYTTAIDGFTTAGQSIRIAGGPYLKNASNPNQAITGTKQVQIGDIALVPVYKKGSMQRGSGRNYDQGGIIIPDQQLESAKEKGEVEYVPMIFMNDGSRTYYAPAASVIKNAEFLKEDKADKPVLDENLKILEEKAAKLNAGGTLEPAKKEEKKKPTKGKLY